MFAITTLLSAALIASAVVHALGEVRRYRELRGGKHPFVSGRRLARRLTAASLLCVLMVAVFLGVNYGGTAFLREKTIFVQYWTACLSGIVGLILLAYLDLRETRQVATREMRLELERALRLIDRPTSRDDERSDPEEAP